MMKVCHEPRIMVNPILYTRSVLREMGGEREKEREEKEKGRRTENFLKLLKSTNSQIQKAQQVLNRIK